jgi:hypothetical protein
MVVKSNVGGIFELAELGIVFQAGEVVDLSFFVKDEDLHKSQELKRALEKKFLIPQGPSRVPSNFRSLAHSASVAFPRDSTVRQAQFIIHMSNPLDGLSIYFSRDASARRAIATTTNNFILLRMIAEREELLPIALAARGRLSSANGEGVPNVSR